MNARQIFARSLRMYWPDPPVGIHPTAVIDHCRLGDRVDIGPHTVIGGRGFGFERDEDGSWFRIPHKGSVRIGDDVEIGACCVIARGTLTDTVIGDRVKIDDHVFIAHNVQVGSDTLIIAGAEISGSVNVGSDCQIGPQVTIREHLTVGDGAQIGIGAVVISDVPAGMVVVGNPARVLRAR